MDFSLVQGIVWLVQLVRAPTRTAGDLGSNPGPGENFSLKLAIKLSLLLNIMFHAPMGRFQSELIYYFNHISPSSHPTLVCFFPVGLSSLIHVQHILWVLKFLLSPGLGSRQ